MLSRALCISKILNSQQSSFNKKKLIHWLLKSHTTVKMFYRAKYSKLFFKISIKSRAIKFKTTTKSTAFFYRFFLKLQILPIEFTKIVLKKEKWLKCFLLKDNIYIYKDYFGMYIYIYIPSIKEWVLRMEFQIFKIKDKY